MRTSDWLPCLAVGGALAAGALLALRTVERAIEVREVFESRVC